ncbi:MAG: hypothetical protein A2579_12695 [Lysobacterales bacterium RIFOXYD1_FULL_69_11]|nr:MAG: hypothetical protein A2190_04970 [Xanthomonadales bacterium RIFOXYA1_FULL_69_10]OHE86437.1 MAG: hypothetical protein A2579_12695 [Xanthomonadales bacterium RIFOXYD1_FULL_69_11]
MGNGLVPTVRRVMLRSRAAAPRGHAATRTTSTPTPTTALDTTRPWLLVVDTALPQPDRDSGSLRIVELMRALVSAGHAVAFVADDGACSGDAADALRADGIHVPDQRHPDAWVRDNAATLSSAVLCRHDTAGHWLPFLRSVAPSATLVFDTVDLHHLRERREADMRASTTLRRSAEATRRRELGLARMADTTWVVSPIERDMLLGQLPGADVRVLSNIIRDDSAGLCFHDRRDLLFVGGLRHPPNRDAVAWLSTEIFPRVRAALPAVRLHVVGAPGLEGLPEFPADSGIVMHGHVPDLQPLLDGCRVGLAPLRFGAGVKGKINLAMAHGQPVVATACAVEGMRLQHGGDVLVADDADAFAMQVVRLYDDATLWQALADRGRESVRRHYSPQVALAVAEATFARRAA